MQRIKKTKWRYYFARKWSLQRYEITIRALTSDFFQHDFKVNLKNIMIKPEEGKNSGIWLDEKGLSVMSKKLFDVVCKDLKNFYNYKKIIKSVQKEWVKAAKKVGNQANRNLSNKQLAKLYDIFTHHHQEHFNKPIWIPFVIEPVLADVAEEVLQKVLKRAKKINDYEQCFQIVFSPEEKNAITKLQERLLEVAIRIKQRKIKQNHISNFVSDITKDFGFIPCYDVIDDPWSDEHFIKELKNLLQKSEEELKIELKDIRLSFKKRHDDFLKFAKKYKMTKHEKELLTMAHEIVFIKDERDDYRRLGSFYGQPLFTEIGRRLMLTTKEAAYLTIDETKNYLHNNVNPPSPIEIKRRVKAYLLLLKHGNDLKIFSGSDIKKVLNSEFSESKKLKVKEIKGSVGSTGKSSGLAVIVRTTHDLIRVTEGCVMVAVTTNPDYVPAMRKCNAIVTDEGGITSHAAIVSRELKVPCIVGTKIATKSFKEGDHLEVDAIKGIIKKV